MLLEGGGSGHPPYKNSHHRKTDFLLVKASFLVKFRQPTEFLSGWRNLTKKLAFTKENQGGESSCRGGVRTPPPPLQ